MKPDLILSLPAEPVPYAVLGHPIAHSLSPAMQQAAFDHCGLAARYYRIEVVEERLRPAVTDLRALPFGGWNCTVPLKVEMRGLCDRVADSAQLVRAVNTVVNEDGTLVGHNTDGIGWSRALVEAFGAGPAGRKILLLGAGGAARAIATQALQDKCAQIVIANRTPARAHDLVQQLQAALREKLTPGVVRSVDWEEVGRVVPEMDLIVNATSAGLKPEDPSVLEASMIPAHVQVYDTLYGNVGAKLRRETETAGAHYCDGLGMLLHQGAVAFTLWTGREAPVDVMRRALADAFSASRR